MNGFNGITILELAEAYAEENNLIASEEELSERFDEDVLPQVIAQYGEDDSIAIREAFNDWSDALHKDGELHESQYNEYCYVGRLAD